LRFSHCAKPLENRRQQIENTITQIVNLIDQWHLVSPFSFIDGKDGSPGGWLSFPGEGSSLDCFDQWRDVLFPTEIEEEVRLMERYTSFVVGVLCGMRATGLNRGQLLERARGFTLQAIGRLEWEERQAGLSNPAQ
jgi:hypothetical protein